MSREGDIWDVLIVGAGPAGSLTVREVARLGCRVLLVDRTHFPRAKVCGCCLNPVGLGVLRQVGLGDLTSSLGAVPLREIRLGVGANSTRLRLGGVALSRERFDTALIETAREAGVEFRPGTTARLGAIVPEGRDVDLTDATGTHTARARIVVAADGLGCGLLARTGLESPARADARIGAGVVLAGDEGFERGVIHMACGRAGYLGLVRLEDGRLDLACALDPAAVAGGRGIGSVAADLLTEVGWPVPEGTREAAWKGTPRLMRTPGQLGAERLFVVGDAAGYIEPFTGEGMSWALRGAVALAPLVAEGSRRWDERLVARWQTAHRRQIRDRQGLCGWFAWSLRRPWLMRLTTRLLNVWPGLAAPFIHHLQTPGKERP